MQNIAYNFRLKSFNVVLIFDFYQALFYLLYFKTYIKPQLRLEQTESTRSQYHVN